MADKTKDILIRIGITGEKETDALKKRNTELLNSIQKNNEALAENRKLLKLSADELAKTGQSANELKIKNIELTSANKAYTSELNNNIKVITSETGSLNEKRAQLNLMNAAYAKLSEEQKKNSADGLALGANIRKTTDELKAEEKALGDTRRNVGNYTDSIIEAGNQMGPFGGMVSGVVGGFKKFKVAALEASGGTSVLNGAMKLLAANPIFAIIAIAAAVFMLLKEAIGRNAQIMDEFAKAMAPVKVILGVLFGIIGDITKLLVGTFAAGMELVIGLFGGATTAAGEYIEALKAMDDAEDKLLNLRIREKTEQKEINNLMALADNRLVQGKARRDAITEAIRIQTKTAKDQAEQEKILLDGAIVGLETEYNLRNKLVDKNYQLTQAANDKLTQEDKDALLDRLNNFIDADKRQSELAREAARKQGTIMKSIITDEKAQRDLQIAAMTDGLAKQQAAIVSNYDAQKKTIEASFIEQARVRKIAFEEEQKQNEGNYKYLLFLRTDYYKDIADLDKQLAEQIALVNSAQERERVNAQRNAAKAEADSRTALERELQDVLLATYQDGFAKERTALLVAFQRKRADLIEDAKFTGKNKQETAALVAGLTEQYNAEALRMERENQQRINDLISGEAIARKELEIELRLAAVREGSQAELDLRLQQLAIQRDAELAEAARLHADLSLVREKFRQEEENLRLEYETVARQKVLDETLQRYQNEIEIARQSGEDVIAMRIEAKQREIDNLQALEGESHEQFIARKLALETQLTEIQQQGSDQRAQISQTEVMIAEAVFNGISALGDIFNDAQEKNAVFAKAMAFFQIGLDTAMALTTAIANAQKAATAGGPAAPYLSVLYTAQAFATVLGAVAKAKALLTNPPKAPGKATGGLITGEGSGTSDSIPVRLSNNESVLNAQSTGMFAPLLSGLNMAGGGVPIQSVNRSAEIAGEQFMSNAISKALAGMPSPVVSVQEFNKVAKRVSVIETGAVR